MIRRIWLAIDVAKCEGRMCRNPEPCARRDIAADPGRPLADFSRTMGYLAECGPPNYLKHIPHAKAVKPVQEQQVKEWIGR